MKASEAGEKISHPGAFLKMKVVEAHRLSVTDAAQALGVTRPALSAVLNGRAQLSSQMALRIEKAFGVPMEQLLAMQTRFDIAQARKREGDVNISAFRPSAIRSNLKKQK